MCFQTIKCMQLIHDIFVDELWIVIIIMTLSLILRIHRSKIHVEVYDFLSQYSFWILKHVARIWLISWFNDEFRHSVLPLWSLLRIRLVVLLDTIVLWGTLLLLFFWAFSSLRHSQSCTVKLTLKVDLSVLKWSLTLPFRSNNRVCLSIFNLFLTHNTCHFTYGRKASLTVWTQSDFLS